MTAQTATKYVIAINEKIKSIKLTELSALQTSNKQKVLHDLQISAGQLSKSLNTKSSKDDLLEAHDKLVQAVDTAGLIGVISEQELTDYYKLLDDIWAAIEKD